MVSFKPLFFFLAFVYFSSTACGVNFFIKNEETSLILHATEPDAPLDAVPTNGVHDTGIQFYLHSKGNHTFTIESARIGGVFVSCKPDFDICAAHKTPTQFRLTRGSDKIYAITSLNGLHLTVGKHRPNTWSLEKPDKGLNQRFDITFD